MKEKQFARELLDFIYDSPSPFHVVENIEKRLLSEKFTELDMKNSWSIIKDGKYFVKRNDSCIVAFTLGSEDLENTGFKIVGAHSDFPSIKIKPEPEIVVENSYVKLNIEIYGGLMLNTWLDRPLSIAGRVSLKGTGFCKNNSKLFNINKPIVIIPNQGTLLNPKLNQGGYEYNKQTDMLPLLASVTNTFEKNNYLLKIIANEINVNVEDISDFEIHLYDYNKGCLVGANEEFISSARLDNLTTVHAGLDAFVNASPSKGANVFVSFDNEEIGNRSKQGSDSPFLRNIFERIMICLNKSREEFFMATYNSYLVSCDVAHGLHPNAAQKHDPTNRPVLNKGFVIKVAANLNFTTDSNTCAAYKEMCKSADIPVQRFVSRSDGAGGFTIAPALASQIDLDSVDIGSPILAMHSIRELSGVYDHYNLKRSFEEFYK